MPPCAAIEWAGRGESWEQKERTSYPSAPSDAAAAPPASPVPTTMTRYFRLFAGFTSFRSNFRLSHFFSRGPGGMRASSAPGEETLDSTSTSASDDAKEDRERDGGEADREEHRERHGELLEAGRVGAVRDAERLEHRPEPVPEVDAQPGDREHVEDRRGRPPEARDEVVEDVALAERRVRDAEGEIEQVVDDEAEDEEPAPDHRPRRRRRDGRLVLAVRDGPRGLPREPELDPGDRVHDHRDEEDDPHGRQQGRLDAEAPGVAVQLRRPLEGLEVPDHVAEDEREQDDPRDRHERLLADEAAPEEAEPGDARGQRREGLRCGSHRADVGHGAVRRGP